MIDDPIITNILFYPRKTSKPQSLPAHIQTLEFEIHSKITLGGILFTKNKSLPTILLFHGNGEIAEDYMYFYELYHQCNLNLAVIDYRGYGFSTGQPFFTSLIHDAPLVYNDFNKWIQENDYLTQIYVMGRSLGSVCASEIGAQNPSNLVGVIFESGFASLANMMYRLMGYRLKETDKEIISVNSNDTRMRKIERPTLVMHGTHDRIIPYSEGELIVSSLINSKSTKFVSIDGAGHNDIFSFAQEYQEGLLAFVRSIA
ncbi:MAG: alpha/beta hydrolase [Candidatus Kariarchaeaceae archaeon]|jgi:pimeloyl-ACP methyl ester carboxylesterase